MPKQAIRFLKQLQMHSSSIDLDACLADFLAQMHAGLGGQDRSSLQMLPTYLHPSGNAQGAASAAALRANQAVIVLDAGGTHLRVGLVSFDRQGTPAVTQAASYPMPGATTALDTPAFFAALAAHLKPLLPQSGRIGLCFSYSAAITPDLDGRVCALSKELQVTGLSGTLLSPALNRAILAIGQSPKRCVVLNDTAAATLGTAAAFPDIPPHRLAGLVLGTGTNACYSEDCAAISGLPACPPRSGRMLVNLESGNYNGLPRGEIDRELDAETARPGHAQLEKMIGGAYQGNTVFRTIQRAAEYGLFSAAFVDSLSGCGGFSMADLDHFCDVPAAGSLLADLCATPADRARLLAIVQNSYERTARIIAVMLVALAQKSGAKSSDNTPFYVAIEGSTIQKSRLLRDRLAHYCTSWINETYGIDCRLLCAPPNATLLGAAIAALQPGLSLPTAP